MTETEWTEVRCFVDHSGMTADEVMRACTSYLSRIAKKNQEAAMTDDQLPLPIPGVEHFNGS